MSYSLASLLQEYSKNKERIHEYLQNKTVEGYRDNDDNDDNDDNNDYNISTGMFIMIVTVSLITWIWSFAVTVLFWKHLPDWARVVAILGLIPSIPGGPIATLVVVYVTKGTRRGGHRGKKKSHGKKRHH